MFCLQGPVLFKPPVCVQKDAVWMHVPKTDEKDESKSKKLVISWLLETQRLLRPLAVVMISVSPGVFFLSLYHTTARDRKSRGFNRDGGTSLKPIIHGLRSLRFCAGSFEWFWYSMMNYHDQMRRRERRGSKKAREQEAERENPGGILCLNSLGVFSVLVEYCTFLWQAYLLSSTHARLSNPMKSQRRSSFIRPERACSRVAHLLIKQRQAPKTLFDRDCGN